VLAVLGAIGLVLAPVYMLRFFQGTFQGEAIDRRPMHDIYTGQLVLLSPLVLLMFVLGIYPYLLTQLMSALGQAGLAR
jgi:NADH:ubiquinone oxidoreductase subunit 4 (subunit M)